MNANASTGTDTTTTDPAGPAAPAQGAPTGGDAGASQHSDSGGQGGGDTGQQTPTPSPANLPKYDPIDKIKEKGTREGRLSSYEQKRVKAAFELEFQGKEVTDAAIDALLGSAEAPTKTEDDTPDPAAPKADGDDESNSQENQEPQDKPDGKADAKADTFLKKVLPHLDNVKEGDEEGAVRKIQFHKQRSDQMGALANKFRELDPQMQPEDGLKAVQRLANIGDYVHKNLGTPEGARHLWETLNPDQPLPAYLGGNGAPSAAPAAGGQGQGSQQPPAALPLTPEMQSKFAEATEILGFDLAGAVNGLIEQAVGRVIEEQVKPLREKHEKVMPVLERQADFEAKQGEAHRARTDIRTAAQALSKLMPDLALSADPETIWAESVDNQGNYRSRLGEDGKPVFAGHPEMPKLARLIRIRAQAKAQGYPSLRAYLGEQALSEDRLAKLQDAAEGRARDKMLADRAKPGQPAPGGRGTPEDGFKVPKTADEVRAAMKNPVHRKKWLAMQGIG